MKLLVDMNLSPEFVPLLREGGWETVHWSTVGDPRATDTVIMAWARENGAVVLTHDLDFGTLLALSQAGKPSVLQVRTQDVTPRSLGKTLIAALPVRTAARTRCARRCGRGANPGARLAAELNGPVDTRLGLGGRPRPVPF